jgi:hypothetical protein
LASHLPPPPAKNGEQDLPMMASASKIPAKLNTESTLSVFSSLTYEMFQKQAKIRDNRDAITLLVVSQQYCLSTLHALTELPPWCE